MTSGDTISRYRIIGPLGKGGMGVVYQAEDTRLRRPVALKFLLPGSLTDRDKQRFLNEARAAALARHPNICPVYDIEEADGELFIAMAYLEGETLLSKAARGPLGIGQAIDIAIQIASGLECAHQLGIVHRDIKSGNIIVSPDGRVSIMDFGLALCSDVTRLSAVGGAMGTPAYMSPEQAQGHSVDHRTDIWSLGVVLFEMLTGALPFRREHCAATLHAILFDRIPAVGSLRAGTPVELQRILERALAKQPERRWQTVHQMAGELKRIQSGSAAIPSPGILTTKTLVLNSWSGALNSKSRRKIPAIAAALLIFATAAFGIYKFVDARRSTEPPSTVRQLPDEKQVLAILPFQIVGAAENTRNVSDGLVEILTAALSDFERFQGMITAIPSSEVRRRGIASAEEARRVYGVNLAITGSAQPAGDKVKFTVNLVDAVKLRQLGSRTFVYDPRNPIASRDQAIKLVIQLLNFDLTPAARTVIAAGDTAAAGAYSAYLKGRGLLARYDVTGNVDKAIQDFKSATSQDPNYALAYAGLGEAYWRKARATGDKQWAALAVRNAEHAVQEDGSLAIVHSILGQVYGTAGREQDAIREFQKAIQLAPGNAEAPRELARVYTNLGRFPEAEASYIQATKSRPTDWYAHMLLGLFYYQRERYAEAEAELKRAKSLTPDNNLIYRNLGSIYILQGRYREAAEELQRALKIKSTAPTYAALAGAYFYQHRFQEAVSAAETAIDLDSSGYRFWGNLGGYYKWAPGNEGKAEPALRRAIELAGKFLEIMPADYNVRASLAEYRARLGDAKGAMAELESIPQPARRSRASQLAVACELAGYRDKAIELIRSNLTSPATLNQIKDDPDLAALWKDPAFQKTISRR